MFDIGPEKLLIILVVALLVLGPEKLPKVARHIGAAWGDLRRFRERIESEVRSAIPDLPVSSTAMKSPLAFLNDLTIPKLGQVIDSGEETSQESHSMFTGTADEDGATRGEKLEIEQLPASDALDWRGEGATRGEKLEIEQVSVDDLDTTSDPLTTTNSFALTTSNGVAGESGRVSDEGADGKRRTSNDWTRDHQVGHPLLVPGHVANPDLPFIPDGDPNMN